MVLTAGDLTTLTDGTISVSATQTDAAGNAQTAAATTTSFVLDTTAPAAPALALGTGVANGATASEATQPSGVVTVTGEAGDSISVTFTNGAHTLTKIVTGTGSAQAVTLTAGDLTTLTDGTISVSATQTDAAGNAQTAAATTTSFVLDTTAPAAPTSLTLDASTDSGTAGDNITNIQAVKIDGSAELGGTVTLYDGATLIGTGTANAITGAFSITTSALSVGPHTITAKATDAAGNTSIVSSGLTVTIDTSVPAETVSILAISGGTSPSNNTVTISGSNGVLAIGEKIQVTSDGSTWTDVVQNTATTWSLVDATTRTQAFSYQARIVNTVGGFVTSASQPVIVVSNGATVLAGGSSGFTAEFTGTGVGTLQLTTSPAIAGTVNAISLASGTSTISGAGNVTTIAGDAIDLTASGGANLVLAPTGAITGAASGISVVQNVTGAITITTSGPVVGNAGRGIFAEESVTGIGSILINGSGNVTGTGANNTGLFAENLNASSGSNITINQTGSISGGRDGIRALTNGNGNIAVTTGSSTGPGANITGGSLYGIEATSNGTGSIAITTNAGDLITSGSVGINAYNQATSIPQGAGSSIVVTTFGTIDSGSALTGNSSRPAGILAGYRGGTTNTTNPAVAGNVTVDNFANINAAGGDGIRAYNFGSGTVTVNDHSGATIIAKDEFGISASTNGIGNVLVTTAAGDIITSGSSGIQAINQATVIAVGANSSVSVTANGAVHSGVHLTPGGSQPQGVSAGYFGSNGTPNTSINGTVLLDNFANVTADAGWGLDAYNWGNGSVTLTDEANTVVSGAQYGIAAYSLSSGPGSSGNVTINVGANATITAGRLYGLAGIAASQNNGGNISITMSNNDIINSGGFGIQVGNQSTSATSASQIFITARGSIRSGFDGFLPAGISAGYNFNGAIDTNVAGNVVVDDFAAITAASGFGINLFNFGVGNLSATLEAGASIIAPAAGFNVFAQGGGNVTVANSGTVAVAAGSGISTGTGNGLSTTGNGVISVTNSGTITGLGSANSAVIQINNNSAQGATFTNSGTVTAKLLSSGLSVAIGANNGGVATNTGSITVNNNSGGTISGNVTLGFSSSAATFKNNAGSIWNVSGSNFFGAAANVISNSGTINIAGNSGFYTSTGLAFNNSGTVNILGGSFAYIGGAVAAVAPLTTGLFSIGDRAAIEFANSVDSTQTVSFVDGKGLLRLDSPTAFTGTMSGLAVGDVIDFAGSIIASSASIAGSILTVTESNSATLAYTVANVQANASANLDVLSTDKIIVIPTASATTDVIAVTGQASSQTLNPVKQTTYIFANDPIVGTAIGININAPALTTATDTVAALINQTSSVSVTGTNIHGVNVATGGESIAIVNAAQISSGGGIGIFANLSGTGAGSIDLIDYGNVSGGTVGIQAQATGTGPINILVGAGATVTGAVSNATSSGIIAISKLGSASVTTLPGTTINSGRSGIFVENQSASVPLVNGAPTSVVVTTSGTINSGQANNTANGTPAAIIAAYLGGTSQPSIPNPPLSGIFGNVVVNNSAIINATSGMGIDAFNYGTGDVSVSNASTITATAAGVTLPGFTQYGIFAFNYGIGNTSVTTAFGSSIVSGGTGINAGNQATVIAAAASSTLIVDSLGTIHSGTNLNNSGSAPSGIQAGYNPGNLGGFNANVFGDVFVIDGGNITADAGEGINAYNFGNGNATVNVGFGVTITALTAASAGSKAPYGIGAAVWGPGNVSVTTSNSDVINSGSTGINAVNEAIAIAAGVGALVTVNTSGSITSGTVLNNSNNSPSGVAAGFLGGTSATQNLFVNGTVIVNNAANISAAAGIGINAYNFGNGDITVNSASGTIVSGILYGIEAHAEAAGASGNIAINLYNNVTVNSTSSYGVFAFSADIGNISVITSPGDVVNSGSVGINAVNEASAIPALANSSIVVTAFGSINSGSILTGTGSPSAGISAGYLGPAPGGVVTTTFPLTAINGEVVVNNSANINAASGDGIRAFNFGIGNVTVNEFAGTITTHASPVNGYGIGISATNNGTGDIHVTTSAGTTINSIATGIAAVNKAMDPTSTAVVPSTAVVSVLAFGTINSGNTVLTGSGDPAAGILAGYNPNNADAANNNVHGNVSVDDYASINAAAGTDGIRGINYGTGSVAIISEAGATISAGRYGIAAFGFNGGNVSITNNAIVSGGTAAIDATTTSTGTVSIDNFGTIVGSVVSGSVTFHNELGALWYLAGNNTFATGADTLINDGTIRIMSGSLDVAAAVTGGGIFTVGNGVTLEFGSSVATGAIVSFLGANGIIKLDHSLTAPFMGQISNLNGTSLNNDQIDLVDLAWTATAFAQYQPTIVNSLPTANGTLTVSDGNGHTEAFNLVNYTGSGHFTVQNDGHGGTIVVDNQAPSVAGDMAVFAVKGGSVILTSTDLSAVDPVASSSPQQLVYTVLGTSHGHLQLGNNPTTTFTLQDIQAGLVRFVTDDASYVGQGSFTVSLSDGLPGVAASTAAVSVYIVDAQLSVLTAGGYNFDQDDSIGAMGSGTIVPASATSTAFEIDNGGVNRDFLVTGSGFAYDATNHVIAGTITSITEVLHTDHTQELSRFDLNVLAAAWMGAVIAKATGSQGQIETLVSPWTFNFIGNTGADAFGASDFNDVFTGNGGDDTFDGQFGYDRVSYRNATGPINVQLAAGIVTGNGGTDTLKSIELVTGTNSADTFDATGFSSTSNNAGSTVTSNTAGLFNEFEGDGGNDAIIGNGQTRISYFHATAGVTVIFNPVTSWATASAGASGIATGDTSVGTDTFAGVNSVRGSYFADTLIGSNNPFGTAENFEGLGGNDIVNGGGGFDRAVYNFAHDGVGITVNLADGTVTGGPDTGTDTLRSSRQFGERNSRISTMRARQRSTPAASAPLARTRAIHRFRRATRCLEFQ